jgi:hypothetical protein
MPCYAFSVVMVGEQTQETLELSEWSQIFLVTKLKTVFFREEFLWKTAKNKKKLLSDQP